MIFENGAKAIATCSRRLQLASLKLSIKYQCCGGSLQCSHQKNIRFDCKAKAGLKLCQNNQQNAPNTSVTFLEQKPKELLSKVNKFGINLKLCSTAIISSTPSAFSFIRLAARPPKTSALVLVNFYPQGRRALILLRPKIEGWFQNRPKIPNVCWQTLRTDE